MSEWIEITDPDAVEISDDGKNLDVLFETNNSGNRYIEIPLAFVRQALEQLCICEGTKEVEITLVDGSRRKIPCLFCKEETKSVFSECAKEVK